MACLRTLIAFHYMAWNKKWYIFASLLIIYALMGFIFFYQMILLNP